MAARMVAVATEAPSAARVFEHAGGCHCGGLRWTFATAQPLEAFAPRACDCDFCTRHRAAWVSDPEGSLRIRDGVHHLRRYRQGSGQAEFLFCDNCGVLVGVVCISDGLQRGAVNRNSFDERLRLGVGVTASPQQLAPEAKRARWSQLWTPATLS